MEAQGTAEGIVTSAYGKFLGRSFRWTHFGTMTFRYCTSAASGLSCFRKWVKFVEKDRGTRVGWFASVERDKKGAAHVHFLLRIEGSVNCRELMRQWHLGYAHIVRYDPKRPGSYYVTKGLGEENAEYDFNYPQR